MPSKPRRYGAKDTATEYEEQERPGSRSSRSLSLWALLGLGVFLAAIFIWGALRPPGGTDPAPNGAPATGIVRQPAPSNNNP
ncbi:hypothetical protein [Rhizobium halophilum]|uniref:hypothetical protein n=1 Tax=Rhizobium halophilum TaxID=2846852 RepID=UPI001EFCC6CB|nr:hypothetical protein [Rhizobium halophilum]MCF6370778.1 hypothetical protein [Rhizobium halophilum]